MVDYTRKKIKVVYKNPADLIPYSNNARTHDSELEFLCNSIKEHGFDISHAIGVDKDMVIIHGHGRRLAALKLGMKEVPVVVRDDLSEEQVMAYRLADNKVSDMSGWDFDLLDQELAFLKDMDVDMTQFGFEDFTQFDDENMGDEGDAPEEVLVTSEKDSASTVEDDLTYRIMIECDTALEQKNLFEEFKERGINCQMLL
jgi:hypothetical protein